MERLDRITARLRSWRTPRHLVVAALAVVAAAFSVGAAVQGVSAARAAAEADAMAHGWPRTTARIVWVEHRDDAAWLEWELLDGTNRRVQRPLPAAGQRVDALADVVVDPDDPDRVRLAHGERPHAPARAMGAFARALFAAAAAVTAWRTAAGRLAGRPGRAWARPLVVPGTLAAAGVGAAATSTAMAAGIGAVGQGTTPIATQAALAAVLAGAFVAGAIGARWLERHRRAHHRLDDVAGRLDVLAGRLPEPPARPVASGRVHRRN